MGSFWRSENGGLEDPLKGDAKYASVKRVGGGSYGQVWLAKNRKTNEQVAIKFIQRGPAHMTKSVLRELLTHSSLCHPHVVLLREVFTTRTHIAIAMEYVPGGDLFAYVSSMGRLSERETRRIIQQTVVALDYCHKMGVVSRDVKLENLLLDKTKTMVKLADFGFAKGPEDSIPHSDVGTTGYTAPEVFGGKQYDGTLADVWSLGVLCFVLLFHQYPFERPDDPPGAVATKLIIGRACNADYVIPKKPKVSEACKLFLRKCLTPDPQKRVTIEQIYADPWFACELPAQARKLNDDCLRRPINTIQQKKMRNDIIKIFEVAKNIQNKSVDFGGFAIV